MTNFPDHAFILAAGFGSRLRPYTDAVPKPMVKVGGVPMIDRALDALITAGVTHVVVNTHYLAEVLEAHLKKRSKPVITLSHEPTLLDTGGGVKKMLPALGDKPFYVLAGDSVWTDGISGNSLLRLAKNWNPDTMDILTLMQPLENMVLTHGVGDYDVLPDGRCIRSKDKTGKYMWTNIRLNTPELYRDAPDGSFSFLSLLDRAESQGRLRALIHDGDWHHISTPADLERVNASIT
jgi:MurNAc alpha-1-phosphate uridylyltransferase